MEQNKYDDLEARALLRSARDQLKPVPGAGDLENQIAAAVELTESLRSLHENTVFTARIEGMAAGMRYIRIHLLDTDSKKDIGIKCEPDDPCAFTLFSFSEKGVNLEDSEQIRFVYNDDEKKIESAEQDEFYVPEPGKPIRKRSPLAVLVEKVIERMKKTES